jgi:GMP synthase (glutamine-hydrolysing)
MSDITSQLILIIDFGSQYTQLIARRVREMGVYSEIHPYDITEAKFKALNPKGVIFSGGPNSANIDNNPQVPKFIFNANIPVLGICYGMQSMAQVLGGQVESSTHREFGHARVNIIKPTDWLSELSLDVWMSHGDKVTATPPGFEILASTDNTPIAIMANLEKKWYGVQFHPEVTHTPLGGELLSRFIFNICNAKPNWTKNNILSSSIQDIKDKVQHEKVLLALSGGVDSSVVAALLHEAIGENLTCVFVDTGLLRLNEAAQVMQMFQDNMHIKVIKIDAKQRFYGALKGITCPEEKRKIIGHLFIEVFDEVALGLSDIKWLAQGTIYPDVIESAGTNNNGASMVIKSHHNVGGLPETLNLKLIEPIRLLFKDEVRELGISLGLPSSMVYRHPFPGPGLGVRILGEVREEFVDILQKADAIFIEELKAHGLYDTVSQAFAVFLPVKSVAVMGDGRHYDYVIALRCVETIDFMTAVWSRLSWDFIAHVSNRINNEVPHVSRVVYDVSGKPPATIEWE